MAEFEGQRDNEEIIFILRKHWIVLLKPSFWLFLGLLIVFIVLRIAGASSFSAYAFFIWLGLGGTYWVYNWVIWLRDVYILTDQRIIDRDQRSLFAYSVSEAPLENIQDITWEKTGFFSTIFNYGNIYIQTAGAKEKIEFENIPAPRQMKERILTLRDFVREQMREGKEASTEDLKKIIEGVLRKKV
jgi:uncharacterized membrane protein YdbT with pleckstrin-like domain